MTQPLSRAALGGIEMTSQSRIVVAWFRRDNFEAVRQMMDDRDEIPATFDAWEKKIEHRLAKEVPVGTIVDKIVIEPSEFAAFLDKDGGGKVDGKTRSRFAAHVARERHNRKEGG
ncbi:MAG: hypothetical protein P0Y66_22295 [Candidatus Kaistia colombiensis]|nr:MAG: hypothetical protein P0Y66_22295 [Kaistia sp.]